VKYVKWVIESSNNLVVPWMVAMIAGTISFVSLFVWWLIKTWQYLQYNILPTSSEYCLTMVFLFILAIAWPIFYYTDRQLFYNGYCNRIDF